MTFLILYCSAIIGQENECIDPAIDPECIIQEQCCDTDQGISGERQFQLGQNTSVMKPPRYEFRAVWADTWHDGLLSASQITSMVNTLGGANYNVVVAEVRKCGDAYYDSAFEPRASNILDPLPFDPLADLISKGHAAGLEIHPWIVIYRIWNRTWGSPPANHVWSLHPEWAMMDSSGNILDGDYYNLDPGVPEVQDYIMKIFLDIVSKYDIDGFNFDYIRYPSGYYWGYNQITQQRFFDEYGFWPPISTSDPNWETWASYRRQQVTDLVRKCYLEVLAIKPQVKMSVDTVGWTGGNPNIDYTQTRQHKEVFQNAKSWIEQHIIDINVLMNYKREYDPAQAGDYRIWSDFIADNANSNGRHSADGQAAYLNAISDSITQMDYARAAGCQGGSTYSYAVTNKDGLPANEFWNAVEKNLYTSQVATPDMSWKSTPTTGIIFGQVTTNQLPSDPIYQKWLYKAAISATGPQIKATQSDATGMYGFIDLAPGVYTVSCSREGFGTLTYENINLSAGQILRLNFDLSDVDGDGHIVTQDCNDSDSTIWADPGEARDLIFGIDKKTLIWNPPETPGCILSALSYDTLRSSDPTEFNAAICIESNDGTDTKALDEEVPVSGLVFYYLVRGDNACPGDGSLGTWSDGTSRSGRPCP